MDAVHALLSHAIDYAGLFPPASLDLPTTVQNYAAYRESPHAWALGRLILPVDRVAEFVAQWPAYAEAWPVALLSRGAVEDDWRLAASHGIRAQVVETKPLSLSEIAAIPGSVPVHAEVYVEVASAEDPSATISAIAAAGLRAKIRTGGTQSAAIPKPAHVIRFIASCIEKRVPFKATAGLHHAVRGAHTLTYEANSEKATMHGFLNILLATAWLADGGDTGTATEMLEEGSLKNFHIDAGQIRWWDWVGTATRLQQMRNGAMVSFGSCSFTEPVEEMLTAGWIA